MSTLPSCCIITLNYNGVEHLEILLPSLLDAAKYHEAEHGARVPVVVLDNRSTKPDVQYVREKFPDVEVVVSEVNDFCFSLNAVIAARPEDVVISLNNDMRVERDFIAPLLRHFESPTVFCAVPKILDWTGENVTNGQRVFEVEGHAFRERFDRTVQAPAFSLEAGCAAFRRVMWAELGGYDPLFRPGYWEDLDLAYRSFARGWQCVYEPSSVIYHREGATFQLSFDREQLYYRNQLLFVTKNIGGWGFLATGLCTLPLRIVRNRRNQDMWRQFAAVRKALPRLPLAIGRRLQAIGRRGRGYPEIAASLRSPVDRASDRR